MKILVDLGGGSEVSSEDRKPREIAPILILISRFGVTTGKYLCEVVTIYKSTCIRVAEHWLGPGTIADC